MCRWANGQMCQWANWALGQVDQWDGPTGLILEEYAHQAWGMTLMREE